jgi:hypothetical protein
MLIDYVKFIEETIKNGEYRMPDDNPNKPVLSRDLCIETINFIRDRRNSIQVCMQKFKFGRTRVYSIRKGNK